MRFPWLQVDTDFLDAKASELGALLGISRREALGLALDLWKWCLSRSPADRPPDGFVAGSAPVSVLAAGVQWTGDAEALVSALVEAGLVERVPDGLRLKGMDRYRATWEKNRRRTTSAGAQPERFRSGAEPVPARKTQTQTQTQKEAEASPASPGPHGVVSFEVVANATRPTQPALFAEPAPAKSAKAARVAREKPREATPDPRHAPLVKALCEAAPDYTFNGGRDAKAVSTLLALADAKPETAGEAAPGEVLRRWRICRGWSGFPTSRHLGDFAENWNAYAAPQRRTGSGPPPPSDWSTNPDLP